MIRKILVKKNKNSTLLKVVVSEIIVDILNMVVVVVWSGPADASGPPFDGAMNCVQKEM